MGPGGGGNIFRPATKPVAGAGGNQKEGGSHQRGRERMVLSPNAPLLSGLRSVLPAGLRHPRGRESLDAIFREEQSGIREKIHEARPVEELFAALCPLSIHRRGKTERGV